MLNKTILNQSALMRDYKICGESESTEAAVSLEQFDVQWTSTLSDRCLSYIIKMKEDISKTTN